MVVDGYVVSSVDDENIENIFQLIKEEVVVVDEVRRFELILWSFAVYDFIHGGKFISLEEYEKLLARCKKSDSRDFEVNLSVKLTLEPYRQVKAGFSPEGISLECRNRRRKTKSSQLHLDFSGNLQEFIQSKGWTVENELHVAEDILVGIAIKSEAGEVVAIVEVNGPRHYVVARAHERVLKLD